MKNFLKISSVIVFFIIIVLIMFFEGNKIISKKIISTNQKNNYAIQRLMTSNDLNEEILNFDNCDYDFNDNGNLILREYLGDADIVIIPEKINEYKVDDIDSKIFINANELEIVKIPISFGENINEILNFKKSEEIHQNDFFIYTTTKEYNEKYLKYLTLSEKEKSKQELIPEKFIISPQRDKEKISVLEINNNEKASEPKANYSASYDLRKKIDIRVERQSPLGLCYAYSTIKSVETNLALRNKITNENLSEIHLAVMSKQGAAGWFQTARKRYFNNGYGPVDETVWSKSLVESKRNEIDTIAYNYCISRNSITEQQLEQAVEYMKKTPAKYSVMKTKDFPAIDGTKKKDNNYKNSIQEQRNEVKQFIMNYGSIWALVSDPNNSNVCGNNGRQIVLNASTPEVSDVASHTASIIGWDDNFDKNNFNCLPEKNRPKANGAYLALNSWGNDWGDNGTFWISYEDYDVDAYMHGVMSVKKGKVNVTDAIITLSTSTYNYNGKERRPQVELKYEDEKYKLQTDYTVEYVNNINPGIASVKITGIGRFTGTVTKTFKINPPTPKITRNDYNTFKYSATGAKSYYVSNVQTKPTVNQEETATDKFELNKWTSATSTGNLKLEEGKTYYVWAKSDIKGGTVSESSATIMVRKMIRNQGIGSELITRIDATDNTDNGTDVTDTITFVLDGTPFWCVAKAIEGYTNPELIEENSSRNVNGYKIILDKDKTISSSAVANSYEVVYYANGGNEKTIPEKQSKIVDKELTLSSIIPKRENSEIEGYVVTLDSAGGTVKEKKIVATRIRKYRFKNWNTEEKGKGESYEAGGKYTENKGTKLYAQWEENEETNKITLPEPVREGYKFNGWYTQKTGGEKINKGDYVATASVTLYAQWIENEHYIVEYNANGGNNNTIPEKQTKTIDKELTLSSIIPKRENSEIEGYVVTLDSAGGTVKEKKIVATRIRKYRFKNWNTEEKGKGESYEAGGKYTENKGTKLYAQWEENEETNKITLPEPVRAGYRFNGWYTQKADGEKINERDYVATASVTLYAQWEKIEEQNNNPRNNKSIKSIKITTKPIKTQYIQNRENLELTGGVLTVTFTDNTTTTISLTNNEIEIIGFDNRNLGVCTLTIKYEENTTTFDVEIIEDRLDNNVQEKIENKTDNNEPKKEETIKEETTKSEILKKETVKNETVKNETVKNEIIKYEDKNQDATTANKQIPNTGKQKIIRIAFFGILILASILYVKYNKIKNLIK